jgi:prevent-host-death family protein
LDETVSLVEVKARLSELMELAAAGEEVVITKRGKPVARLSRPDMPRRPVNLKRMRELTARMSEQPEGSEAFMRRMRSESRF